ncbi:hypothetical protein CFP56_043580 [Quercus suber]|uniref:Uncharacterized protein n=1 Tax=Quercus suber TaxID=58331 RepID=A0AAW0IR95_QUESU
MFSFSFSFFLFSLFFVVALMNIIIISETQFLNHSLHTGISTVVAGIILISIVAFYNFKRECLSCGQWSYGRKTRNEQKVEAFIRNYGSLAPKR